MRRRVRFTFPLLVSNEGSPTPNVSLYLLPSGQIIFPGRTKGVAHGLKEALALRTHRSPNEHLIAIAHTAVRRLLEHLSTLETNERSPELAFHEIPDSRLPPRLRASAGHLFLIPPHDFESKTISGFYEAASTGPTDDIG